MDKKNNFIDFEQLPFDQFMMKHDSTSKEAIIKKADARVSGKIKKITVPVNEGDPQIHLYEKDGIADHIEFICTCGKKVRIKLNYENFPDNKNED